MYFPKIAMLLLITACISVNAANIKRKIVKTKIKKQNLPNIISPQCGCQNPLAEIINCGCRTPAIDPVIEALGALEIVAPGCRGPVLETSLGTIASLPISYPGYRAPIIEPALTALAPVEIALPGCKNPIIDIPNYRYAEPLELNPLGCLFPSIDIPNYGLLTAPMMLPSVEYYNVDLPCGCPGPQCGCRAPAVKLPACPREYVVSIDVPNSGYQAISACSNGAMVPIIQVADEYLGSVAPACGCQIPCSCPRMPVTPCGCKSPCSCPEYQILSCGCQGSCSCSGIPLLSCGCKGACGCSGIPVSCGCQGPCSCPVIQSPVGLLPGIEVPSYGCGCGLPGCDCVKYLRQVTLQPPFL